MNTFLDKDSQIELLKRENEELKNKLNKYISAQKKYYEANKDKINEKKRIYQKTYYENVIKKH